MGFEAATKGAQEIVKVESDRDKTAEEVHAVASGLLTRGQVNVFGVGEGTIQQVSVRTLNQCVIFVARKVTYKRQPRKAERVQGRTVRRLTEDSGDEEVQGDEGPPKYTYNRHCLP